MRSSSQFRRAKRLPIAVNMSFEPYDPDYPIDALPPLLRRASEYIHINTQAPMAMCASSVLAAAIACVHPRLLACWRPGVRSPGTLFFVLEAETGERKTSNDDIAFKEHTRFEARQYRLAKEDEIEFQAQMVSWQAIGTGLRRKLEASVRGRGDQDEARRLLEQHEKCRPVPAKRPLMLISDITPEALEHHLATVCPWACVLSRDGSDAFGAGLFDKPSMLNGLWDKGSWSSKRIGRGVTEVSGASLCIYIQIQGPELDRLISGRARSAITGGHTTRWFFCKPKSTQGTRTDRFCERPREWITDFWARNRQLLSELESAPFPLRRRPMKFSKAARELLAWYKDRLELELIDGKRFAQMRGVAGKSTELAARLAADIAEHLGERSVSAELVRGTIRIAAWHLNQYRLRFCPYTEQELDVIALREWLHDRIPLWLKRPQQWWWFDGPELSQIVHNRLRRDVVRLRAAIRGLEELDGSVRLVEPIGRGWFITFEDWMPRPSGAEIKAQLSRWGASRRAVESAAPPPPVNAETTLWPGVDLP